MVRLATQQLSRSTQGDLRDARRHGGELVVAARGLVVAAGHDPDLAPCSAAGCGLDSDDPSGRWCAVAHRLAHIDGLGDVPTHTPTLPLDEAIRAFVQALEASVETVRACRQTAHPANVCWFTTTPGGDGCRDILQLVHRLL